jgi:hypothetical protein
VVLFDKRNPEQRSHTIAIARDVVEILAILAAGVWAFYVFAYENRIKPSLGNPQVEFSTTMTKVAERNGTIAVSLDTEMRNVGQVPAHFIGYAIWVFGVKATRLPQPRRARGSPGTLSLPDAFYREGHRTAIYGFGYVTSLGDPATSADLLLDPGDVNRSQDVILVPAGKFDILEAYIHARYTKYDNKVVPTKLALDRFGYPRFVGDHANNWDFDNVVSRISIM